MTRLPRSPGSTLVLWLNQETVHRLHLAVLATMRPVLDPAGHRVPRTKPTCLLHTWKPHRQRPFAIVLHLHQHESSRNLHLHYLAKNQSTQCCQSLITQESDHPPVLEPHMVLRRRGQAAPALGRGTPRGGDGASLENFDLYKMQLQYHCVDVGLLADECDCRVAGADARTSPRRFVVCRSRVWRPCWMASLVLVA
jgi:hypothetical protein